MEGGKDPLGLQKAYNAKVAQPAPSSGADVLGLDAELKKKIAGGSSDSSSNASSVDDTISSLKSNGVNVSAAGLDGMGLQEKKNPAPFQKQEDKDAELQRQIDEAKKQSGFRPVTTVASAKTAIPTFSIDKTANDPTEVAQRKQDELDTAAKAQSEKDNPGSWSNTLPQLSHAVAQVFTKPLRGLANIERDLVAVGTDDSNPGARDLYKKVPIYNENGTLVDDRSELTDYGKSIVNGEHDALGNFILSLDAYNEESNKADIQNRLPATFMGNTVNGFIHIAPDIALTALFPEGEVGQSGNVLSYLKGAVSTPFSKLLAAKGVVNAYNEAGQAGETGAGQFASAIGGGVGGAVEGTIMHGLGDIAGNVMSKPLYNKLVQSGLVAGGKYTKAGLDAFSDATIFGAYPLASNLIQNKPIDWNEVEAGFGTGLGFGALKAKGTFSQYKDIDSRTNELLADRKPIAVANFLAATDHAIKDAWDAEGNSADLNSQAMDYAQQTLKEKDLDKKTQLAASASTFAKVSDIKATTEAIMNDKEGFINSINSSDLPEEQKKVLVDKANSVSQIVNPAPAAVKQNEIETHQENIATLDTEINQIQATPAGSNPILNPESVDNLIDLVEKRTDEQVALLDKASEPVNTNLDIRGVAGIQDYSTLTSEPEKLEFIKQHSLINRDAFPSDKAYVDYFEAERNKVLETIDSDSKGDFLVKNGMPEASRKIFEEDGKIDQFYDEKLQRLGIIKEGFGSGKQIEDIKKPTETVSINQDSPETKSTIDNIFSENNFESIGNKKQYGDYLNSIFPDTKINEVMYHNTRDLFDIDKYDRSRGMYFTSMDKGHFDLEHTIRAILNSQNPKNVDAFEIQDKSWTKDLIDQYRNKGYDSLIADPEEYKRRLEESGENPENFKQALKFPEIMIFDPEQIHILGSKNDIQKFKNYVEEQKTTGGRSSGESGTSIGSNEDSGTGQESAAESRATNLDSENGISNNQPINFQSKELGRLSVNDAGNGKYHVSFEDGTQVNDLSPSELKDVFGVDPGRIKNNPESGIHATDDEREIARMYDNKVRDLQDTGSIEGAIAAYGPRTNASAFASVNDGNNVNAGIRLNYFRDSKSGDPDLHNQAEEINRQYFNGVDRVSADDIAEFMIKYPGGSRSYSTAAGNPELRELADRYNEITGKEFDNRLARKYAQEFSNLSIGEINSVQNEFDGLSNVEKIKRFLNDELNGPGLHADGQVIRAFETDLNNYIADPSNEWNVFHDVFGGEILSPEEINEAKKEINEQVKQFTSNPDSEADSGSPEATKAVEDQGGSQGSEGAAEYDKLIEEKRQELAKARSAVEKKLASLSDKNDLFESAGVKKGEEAQASMFDIPSNTEPENISKILEPLRAEVETAKRELDDLESNRDAVVKQSEAQLSLEDDLPFQLGEGNAIPKERAAAAQRLLEEVFPNVETKFHTTVDSFEKAAKDAGINTEGKKLPNAFVDEKNVIHFNPEKLNQDTQVHEYGHILTRWAKDNAPSIWGRMLQIGNEAKNIHTELGNNGYDLKGNRLSEEAFVTLLGRDGAGKLDSAIKNSGTRGTVSKFINDAWLKFQRFVLEKTGFDVTKFKNIKNMGIQEFLDTINSKYLLSGTKVSDIGNADVRSEVSQSRTRPEKKAGETMADYAKRLIEWTKEEKESAGDTNARELRDRLAPTRKTIADITRAYKEGFRNAKDQTKEAFLEYDRYQKEVARERLQKEKDLTKEQFLEYDRDQKNKQQQKIKALRENYDAKVQAEKDLRQEQTKKLKDTFDTIRKDIKSIIVDLNKSRALGGVKLSDKQLLSFSNQLNNVKTLKGLDRFRDYVAKVVKDVDVIRDIQDSKSLMKDAKKLLKVDYVTQNMKTLIRDLVTLNPYSVENPKELKDILEDINKGQRSKDLTEKTEQEIYDYIAKERESDLNQRVGDILTDQTNIEQSDEMLQYGNTQTEANFPGYAEINSKARQIVNDPETTYSEKVKKLNTISDALAVFEDDLKNTFRPDPYGNLVADRQVADFDKILYDLENQPKEIGESLRDSLEDIASARQDSIEIEPGMSPEQQESLKILQQVNLSGQDADTLRLFNNVLDNVVNNDDHSGIGIFEAKAIGSGKDGALKLVDYLNDTGRTAKNARFKTKLGELRAIGANLSVIMTRIANNDFDFLTKLNTGTHFDQIRNGFAQAKHQYDELVGKKLEKVFKENPTIAKSPESIQKLSLFSYINQNREFSSPEQQNRELRRRIEIIQKDIELKQAEGLKDDNSEGEIEQGIWNEFKDKINVATGIDVYDPEQLKNLTYDQVKSIDFLTPGERSVYDVYRDADSQLRTAHEDVVKKQLNMTYEGWNNHMRDGYRFLGSGLVDVVTGDNLGFSANNENTTGGSSATIQRVKGDPLATKSGEKQRVLNLNFFDVQNQNIKDQLFDIHTLKNRQIFDEALKSRELRDALGNENHNLYKNTIKDNVLNEMGLGKGVGEKELRLLKQGLNIVTKLGTFKQLLSASALVKQASATIFNTLTNIGGNAKLMADAAKVLNTDAVKDLIKKHPISERGDNMASLNTLRDEAIADKDNTVAGKEGKGVIKKFFDHYENVINKYFLQLNPDGTQSERAIAQPIKYGDVKTGEWAWVTYYADHLIKKGEAPDFDSIDWSKEAATPNREAAEYAENMTSKQLNENTKAARSKLINSNNAFYAAAKTLLFPFGSFNMHKFQTLVENMRTLASKDTFVNSDYRNNQASTAAKSLASAFVEEAFFQGIKLSIGYGLTAFVTKGLAYGLSSLFGDDKEKKEVLDKIDQKLQQKRDNFVQQWYTNTLGNYFFGGLGNGPQDAAQRGINKLTNSQFFFEPNISVGQQLSDANNYGMYGAAFNGAGDIAKDAYRIFDNTDKYHVPVNITPYQKSVIATSLLSNMLSFAGLNDADLNRSVEALRKQVEYNLASKFHEPNYRDLSAPTPLKIGNKVVTLSQEHQDYYEQIKEPYQQRLEAKHIDPKRAATMASQYAKSQLFAKFGYKKIIEDGEVQKAKKKK